MGKGTVWAEVIQMKPTSDMLEAPACRAPPEISPSGTPAQKPDLMRDQTHSGTFMEQPDGTRRNQTYLDEGDRHHDDDGLWEEEEQVNQTVYNGFLFLNF